MGVRLGLLGLFVVGCDTLSTQPSRSPPRRVVSFDLDDTIWPIADVVRNANAAVERQWACLAADDVQIEMKQLRKRASEDGPTMSYTAARTLAYQALLGGSDEEAEAAFNAWLDARNAAAAEHLFDDVIPCLTQLVEGEDDPCLLVAITNGRGDPSAISVLAPFFSFTVSGEDHDIFPHRKPSRVIFDAAVERARGLGWAGKLGKGETTWWHVGDDRVNDVEAAAALGMRTVLLERSSDFQLNPFSTMTPEAQKARAATATRADVTLGDLANLQAVIKAFDSKVAFDKGDEMNSASGSSSSSKISGGAGAGKGSGGGSSSSGKNGNGASTKKARQLRQPGSEAPPPSLKDTMRMEQQRQRLQDQEADFMDSLMDDLTLGGASGTGKGKARAQPLSDKDLDFALSADDGPSSGTGAEGAAGSSRRYRGESEASSVERHRVMNGVKLAAILETLVKEHGWQELAALTGVRCFEPEGEPTVKSSLKFLRKSEHRWARGKVEDLYVSLRLKKEE